MQMHAYENISYAYICHLGGVKFFECWRRVEVFVCSRGRVEHFLHVTDQIFIHLLAPPQGGVLNNRSVRTKKRRSTRSRIKRKISSKCMPQNASKGQILQMTDLRKINKPRLGQIICGTKM